MHGAITIPDLDKFLAETSHPGSITGTIDFVPLGTALPSTTGVFKLFSPTNDPATKYMVYELGFNANGKSYYMAGHKDVKKAHLMNLWSATTTLYTQLHEGTDTSAPVVGAGVISLSVAELLAMIPTMHPINTHNAQEAAAATAKFGKFFLGELWDTYVKK
jgi:cholesterol oxidase